MSNNTINSINPINPINSIHYIHFFEIIFASSAVALAFYIFSYISFQLLVKKISELETKMLNFDQEIYSWSKDAKDRIDTLCDRFSYIEDKFVEEDAIEDAVEEDAIDEDAIHYTDHTDHIEDRFSYYLETDLTVYNPTVSTYPDDKCSNEYAETMFENCTNDYDVFLAKYIYYTRFEDYDNLAVMDLHVRNCQTLSNIVEKVNDSSNNEYMIDYYEEKIGNSFENSFAN